MGMSTKFSTKNREDRVRVREMIPETSVHTRWCPPVISWFINHSKYIYIYHKPWLLELQTNLANYGAPPCKVLRSSQFLGEAVVEMVLANWLPPEKKCDEDNKGDTHNMPTTTKKTNMDYMALSMSLSIYLSIYLHCI